MTGRRGWRRVVETVAILLVCNLAIVAAEPRAGGVTTRSGLPWPSGATGASDAFASWRGRPFDIAVTFEDDGSWTGTELVWALQSGELTNFDGTLVISVPMLSDGDDTFDSCAAGVYDSHFRALGDTLNRFRRQNSYIRLGWEGNGDWYPWSAGTDPAGWKGCFRRDVQVLRAVAPEVRIDWTMNHDGPTNAVAMYPGDDVVDVIGVDYYNPVPAMHTQAEWDRAYDRTRDGNCPVGIGAWLAFAHAHGKKLSVPEWGVNNRDGTGDDAVYIQNMYDFFSINRAAIAYEAYFNSHCPDFCIFPSRKNPEAAAKYRQLWGG
jgi:hypothetical protein